MQITHEINASLSYHRVDAFRQGVSMDDKELGRIAELEADVQKLRKDLNKLILAHCRRNEVCHSVAENVEQIAEKLGHTFKVVFPRNDEFLDEIDDALARASKNPKS
jgi:hypothetical protein